MSNPYSNNLTNTQYSNPNPLHEEKNNKLNKILGDASNRQRNKLQSGQVSLINQHPAIQRNQELRKKKQKNNLQAEFNAKTGAMFSSSNNVQTSTPYLPNQIVESSITQHNSNYISFPNRKGIRRSRGRSTYNSNVIAKKTNNRSRLKQTKNSLTKKASSGVKYVGTSLKKTKNSLSKKASNGTRSVGTSLKKTKNSLSKKTSFGLKSLKNKFNKTRKTIYNRTKNGVKSVGTSLKKTKNTITKKTSNGVKSLKTKFKFNKNVTEKRITALNLEITSLNEKIARYLIIQVNAQMVMGQNEVNTLTEEGKMIPLKHMNCLINKLRVKLNKLEDERDSLVPPTGTCPNE